MNRSVKLLFVVSLLLNLLLAGVVIGHIWWHEFGPWPAMIDAAAPSLPADQKAVVAKAMQKIHDDTDGLHKQIMDARDQAAQAMKAEPFDKAAYLAATQHLEDLHKQMAARINAELANAAGSMTPEERSVLAELTRRPPFGGPPGGRKPDGEPHAQN